MNKLLFCLLPLLCFAKEPATLSVRGDAVIYKPADQFSVSISVITEEENAQKALEKNNEKIITVLNELKNISFSENEIRTGQFSISPIYSSRPNDAPFDWRSEIVGFRVNNNLVITSQKLNLIGQLITKTITAGADSLGDITFSLKDQRVYRREAIEQATKNAIEDAKSLSDAANLELVRIRRINLDRTESRLPTSDSLMFARKNVTPIFENEVSIPATVFLEIEVTQE